LPLSILIGGAVLKRYDPDELWRVECELAFAWKHRRDRRALTTLIERFQPLVLAMAGERFQAAQLDKGVKVINSKQAKKNPELAGHFAELMQAGQVGLLEAANLYDGRARFATYARHWIFKRMSEYVRWNWNVVHMPEPAGWKVAKEDQIPPTVPNENLNPSDNPCSIDKKAKRSRHITLSTPREDADDNSRAPEEWIAGRLHAGANNYDEGFSGADYFEPTEYQFRAHETMEALARAFELETLSATADARAAYLTQRKFRIIRARFPWAIDVKNAPDREDGYGFPRKHTRQTIGNALGISDEWVRRLEDESLAEMRRSKLGESSLAEMRRIKLMVMWASGPHNALPQAPDRFEFLVDRLAELLAKVLKQQRQKRWLKPSFLYEEEVRGGKLRPRKDYLKDKRLYLQRQAAYRQGL
jgi:RNA polymerase sigma factor (sigma-70 family)